MGFTKKSIAALTLPKGKPYLIVWDDNLPGFGIRLNPTSRVWVVQYRAHGKSRRETIGRVDAVPLDTARGLAQKTLARVRLGSDPHAERAEANARRAVTFEKVAERYLLNARERLKPRSYEEVARHLSKHWSNLHPFPLNKVDRSLVAAGLEAISQDSGPIAANRARAALSALFSYALGTGMADINPVVGTIKPGDETRRDHVLLDSELSVLWRECGESDYGRIVRLLLLTGQRRDEVGSMRWSEINFDQAMWTIPAERTKNGRSHEVPLSSQVIAVLQSVPRLLDRDFVFGAGKGGFSGWSKAKRILDQKIEERGYPVKPWRVHDLRRTCATGMANLGIPPHVVEAVLNHVSGTKAGVAGIYNRAAYREEKRSALQNWGDFVKALGDE
jgi:integrase